MEYKYALNKSDIDSIWNFKSKEEYVDKWFLMESPIPILAIWVAYILFVLKIGPETMKKRPAFQLRNVIILYNAVQVIVSILLFNLGMSILQDVGYMHVTCQHDDKTERKLSWAIYLYFLSKLSELLDTIFFVLRKKQNQVSFLHIYHHSIMLWSTWFTLKLEPSYYTTFLGTLNTFVHIIMYTYYGLSAFPPITKYLWWKKYITSLQLIQFVMIVIHMVANYITTDCPPSSILSSVILVNGIFFIYLFGDFYKKSYNKKTIQNDNQLNKSNETTDGVNKKHENGIISDNLTKRNSSTNCGKIVN
ncbi:elongation of very long chain fatty acids protein 7-like [Galleria mellonella]|uniref:Elongation of very long chain fatty acids protein n=1 Tax=Galleria mellonella TaxID=7137 RepID=A0ABM3MPQ3_GALME|nr:elongation of very long chain fatty acids protein 7-like [Galleria mellonella]